MRRKIKTLIESLTKTHIFRTLPHGTDPIHDIKRLLPNYRCQIIFDVGANVGQTATKFLNWFPKAKIYCFEPVTSTFVELKDNLLKHNNIECIQLAFGATNGYKKIVLQGPSDMFSLSQKPVDDTISENPGTTEIIKIETISNFCNDRNIRYINYLKIDTEGFDLEVLKGASDMLNEGNIDVIDVEVGMNPQNQLHVPFEKVKIFLEKKGYSLFGIYEQTYELFTKQPFMRRSNSSFVSRRIVEMNGIS